MSTIDKTILMALEKDSLRDELLLYFGHMGIKVFVSTNEKQIKHSLNTKSYDYLILQMNYESFDALEILFYMRDAKVTIPVFLLNQSITAHYDFSMFDEVVACFYSPLDSNKLFNEIFNTIETDCAHYSCC